MNDASSEGSVSVFLHSLSLRGQQRVKAASGRRSTWEKDDGTVVRAMRRQRSGPGLVREFFEIEVAGGNTGEVPWA